MTLQEQLNEAIAKIAQATAGLSGTGGGFQLREQEEQNRLLRGSFLSTIQEQTLIKLDLESRIKEALPEGTTNLRNIGILALIIVGGIIVLR